VSVEPGSIEYSAVIQPWPLPRNQRGTPASSVMVHNTFVRPIEQRTDASGFSVKSGCKSTGRNSSLARPSRLIARLSFAGNPPTR
jgi:hypothetical protein